MEPVEIGPGCWIGTGAVILPGARIGRNVVVAAGAVGRGGVPDHAVGAGGGGRGGWRGAAARGGGGRGCRCGSSLDPRGRLAAPSQDPGAVTDTRGSHGGTAQRAGR